MKNIQKKRPGFWRTNGSAGLMLLLGITLSFSMNVAKGQMTPQENRWVIIIDTADADLKTNEKEFKDCRDIIGTLYLTFTQNVNILPDHIITYSKIAASSEFWPTSENIKNLLDAIRNPDYPKMKIFDDNEPNKVRQDLARLREEEGTAELIFIIRAIGVSDQDDTKFMIVPSDVNVNKIKSTKDPGLISICDIEDAMLHCYKDNKAIERTFLMINSLSDISVTRGKRNDLPIDNITINKIPDAQRSRGNDEDESQKFAHWRMLTSDQSIVDKKPDNFYQALQKGLGGYADLTGNGDGIVDASELAVYIEMGYVDLTKSLSPTIHNGNDPFSICSTDKKPDIPVGLFEKLSDVMNPDEIGPDVIAETKKREKAIVRGKQQQKGNDVL